MKINSSTVVKGGLLYVAGTSAAYMFLRQRQKHGEGIEDDAKGVIWDDGHSLNTFKRISTEYDAKINMDEMVMGIRWLRWWLIKNHAQGMCLEVGTGTGRNMAYYDPKKVKSVIFTDRNRDMMLEAKEKQDDASTRKCHVDVVQFALADIENLLQEHDGNGKRVARQETAIASSDSIDIEKEGETRFGPALRTYNRFPPQSFDTVVSTFSLCSCRDPVVALKEMARVLKPGGKILLLEHGKASWSFVNSVLDAQAMNHFKRWGCEWNRNILEIVEQSGLKVDYATRWHFGTTYYIIAGNT